MDQAELFDPEEQAARSLLDQLLEDSRLFSKSADYKALLDFVVRMRNFAPFNAMLLQVQKPGLRYAASARDWGERFNRTVKQDARPLLILWPFGPVALVYDFVDTDGDDVPEHVFAFPAKGTMTESNVAGYVDCMARKGLETIFIDAGDNKAGSITAVKRAVNPKDIPHYTVRINKNHSPNAQFATLAHELGHLYLGHLGRDKALNIPGRNGLRHNQREIEAESVAYLVCSRHGVEVSSQSYLASHVEKDTTIDNLDLYQVMRASGHVETLLGLAAHSKI